MHSVYLEFDGNDKEKIESFRKANDSLSEKVEAHITVVFPNTEINELEIVTAIKGYQNSNQAKIKLSNKITYDGDIGYLKVIEGSECATKVYAYLSDKLGIKPKQQYIPHVTVVRDPATKPETISISNCVYQITAIVVEQIHENGMGKIIYRQKM